MTREAMIHTYCVKAQLFSLAALLFLLPFTGIVTIKDMFFFLLAGGVVLSVMLDRQSYVKAFEHTRAIHLFVSLSFLWGLMSLAHAVDPAYSLHQVLTKMAKQYLLFFFAYYSLSRVSFKRIEKIFLFLIFCIVVMSLAACYQFYQHPVFFENRVSGFTGAFYRLATLLVIGIPIVLVFTALSRGWIKRVLLFGMFTIFAALFFTFTRAAWIAVIVELCVLIGVLLKPYRKTLLALVVLASFIFSFLAYKSVIPTRFILHGSERPRLIALEHSLDVIRQYPFTGIGYGKKTFSIYHPEVGEVLHAHNIFLNTAVEVGIPGLLIFIVLMIILVKDYVKALHFETDPEKKIILAGIFASFIGFIAINQFDFMYHGWPAQMFWTLSGAGYAIMKPVPNKSP